MTEAIFEAGSWIYKMLFTLLIAIVLVACVGIFLNNDVNTAELQGELLRNRILFDPGGIWYVDALGAMHPGILLPDNFNQTHIDRAFQYPPSYGGARLVLIDGGTSQVRYINEETFTRIATNAARGLERGGAVTVHRYPVVIGDTAQRNAYLYVEIATPERA